MLAPLLQQIIFEILNDQVIYINNKYTPLRFIYEACSLFVFHIIYQMSGCSWSGHSWAARSAVVCWGVVAQDTFNYMLVLSLNCCITCQLPGQGWVTGNIDIETLYIRIGI